MGIQRARRFILHTIGGADPPDKRKEGEPMYVTYTDFIQTGIFIVALVGLCYTIFKSKK